MAPCSLSGFLPAIDLRSTLELLYFASGVILAVVACLGLWQLKLTKKAVDAANKQIEIASANLTLAKDDIAVRSLREAVVLAAQRCQWFAEDHIPRYQAHLKQFTERGIGIHEWALTDTKFTEASLADPEAAQRWIEQINSERPTLVAAISIVNDLEAFAIYFSRGAADEETAYPVVGAVFCSELECFAPFVIELRRTKVRGVAAGVFENAIKLYEAWHLRLRQKQLEAQASAINLQLANIKPPELPRIR